MNHQLVAGREDRARRGIVMMLAAYFLFALVDTSVKWLLVAGMPFLQLAFMRYFGHFLLATGGLASKGTGFDRFLTNRPWPVLARAILIFASTTLNFLALQYLPLSVTGTILFSAPIIVSALSMPLLGERVGPWRWAAIIVGFLGILLVVRPFGESFHWAAILSVIVAICMAFYSILTRLIAGEVSSGTMQFYIGVVGATTLAPVALTIWQDPATSLNWTLLIAIGILAWAGHELLTRAHRYAPASTLMPYTYSFLLYLTAADVVLFDRPPDGWTMAGAALIVLAGLTIWWREGAKSEP